MRSDGAVHVANRIMLGGAFAAPYPMVAARVTAYIKAGQKSAFPAPEITLDAEPAASSAFGAARMLHQLYLSHDERTPRRVAVE
jgi:hypothetical protein